MPGKRSTAWASEEIATSTGTVEAKVHEGRVLAWHPVPWSPVPGGAMYTVTHLPSGNAVTNVRTQAQAKALIMSLVGVPGLEQNSPPLSAILSARDIVSSTTSPPRKRTSKKELPSRWPLVPKYRPGFTPSREVRLLDSKLGTALERAMGGQGDGYLTAARAAIAAHWREEIMIRVVPGLLLDRDVPALSPPTPTPSGDKPRPSTISPQSFKRSYNELLEIGDRLQAGALKFLALYREGQEEGWTEERVARWRKLDARWVALVHEGWQTWGLAAVCFHQLPREFQAKVRAKLGYIGSYERGWHELGIKTFLRHPEIHEVAPVRRDWTWREGQGEFD